MKNTLTFKSSFYKNSLQGKNFYKTLQDFFFKMERTLKTFSKQKQVFIYFLECVLPGWKRKFFFQFYWGSFVFSNQIGAHSPTCWCWQACRHLQHNMIHSTGQILS